MGQTGITSHHSVQLSFPDGAFNCWAYMTCNEAIQAFMALISSDSLQSATSSLLLVRAELWHYALEKVPSHTTHLHTQHSPHCHTQHSPHCHTQHTSSHDMPTLWLTHSRCLLNDTLFTNTHSHTPSYAPHTHTLMCSTPTLTAEADRRAVWCDAILQQTEP